MIVRNFTWDDVQVLVDLITLVREKGGDGRTVTLSILREELAQPGLAPEENCTLFANEKGLQAYSVIHPELRIGRTVLEMGIHPDSTGAEVKGMVVQSAVARAQALGARVLHVCVPAKGSWGNLLVDEGLSHVRSYSLMRWQQTEVPAAELPQGFGIEKFQPGHEEKLTKVQNASFDGSWGFCPNTIEEVQYRAGMNMSTRGGIFFLNDGSETAGYCWTCIHGHSANPIGVIGMIGIDPVYRGRGLSKPILLAGMRYLHSSGVKYIGLDVDGLNEPAIKLYTSVGFKQAMELHWFEARLSGV